MQDGARFVLDHEHLRPMLLTGLVWNLSWFVMQAAYVPYAIHVLGLSSQVVGATLGCYGAGMIAGSLLAPWFVSRMPFGRAIQLGPAVSVAAAGAMVLTLLVPTSTLAGLSFFLFGAGPVVWTITTSTLRQSVTPGGMLGRVGAVFLTVNAGARPVGAALGAAVGTIWGGQACLLLAFAGFSIQAIIILASPVNGLRRLPA
jgi:predicted MFS family arabinose efflux permease